MAVVTPENRADARPPAGVVQAGRRISPPRLLSILLDAMLGLLAYVAAYWLRFDGEQLQQFLPGARETAPIVVSCQIVFMLLFGSAPTLARMAWAGQVAGGIASGTAMAAVIIGVTIGFEGLSRAAFGADALLFVFAALSWRAAWILRLHMRQRAAAARQPADELTDRAAELTTLKGVVLSLYTYRELLKNLVFKELKLKYRGSVFGFLWSLVNPLLMMAVYTLAFTYILQIRSEGFVFSLMLGLLSWTFFASSAGLSTGAIVDNAGLLKSVLFPRAILPIATVLFNLAQFLLTLAVFLPAMLLWYRVPLASPMLLFPAFLTLQVIFTIGVALILATATAFFRDVRHLLEIALAVLFWTTPIVYELSHVPERLHLVILLSPVSPFVVAYQQIFYRGTWPDAPVWAMAATHSLGAIVIGTLLFLAFEDRFTEQL